MSPDQIKRLWKDAVKAQKKAYAPYSKFKVGAAVLAGGKIYLGANVENASYGATICAERAAILAAVTDGHKRLDAISIVTKNASPPCGICLQVMTEFSHKSLPIFLGTPSRSKTTVVLQALLTLRFKKW